MFARLASLQLGDHRLLDPELRGELAPRQSARISQSDELLFDPHRLQLRLDGSGEIRIHFRPSIDGSNGATAERHDYRPFLRLLELVVHGALQRAEPVSSSRPGCRRASWSCRRAAQHDCRAASHKTRPESGVGHVSLGQWNALGCNFVVEHLRAI